MVNKKLALAAVAALAVTAAAPASAAVWVGTGTATVAADGTVVFSTIEVPASFVGKITSIVVTLIGLSGEKQGDVSASVLSSSGAFVNLTNYGGGTTDLSGDYTFSDDGTTLLVDGSTTAGVRDTGTYDFVSSTAVGTDAAGLYRLRLQDRGTDGEATSITGWTLFLTVPEPATWAMMLGGFGFVGGMMRRRKTVRQGLATA